MQANVTTLQVAFANLQYLARIGRLSTPSPYYIKHGVRINLSRALPPAGQLDDNAIQLLRRLVTDEHQDLFALYEFEQSQQKSS